VPVRRDKLTRSLQNSMKTFREVIVVHNLKEVMSRNVLEHLWAVSLVVTESALLFLTCGCCCGACCVPSLPR
jgi:hypothetical protein